MAFQHERGPFDPARYFARALAISMIPTAFLTIAYRLGIWIVPRKQREGEIMRKRLGRARRLRGLGDVVLVRSGPFVRSCLASIRSSDRLSIDANVRVDGGSVRPCGSIGASMRVDAAMQQCASLSSSLS